MQQRPCYLCEMVAVDHVLVPDAGEGGESWALIIKDVCTYHYNQHRPCDVCQAQEGMHAGGCPIAREERSL